MTFCDLPSLPQTQGLYGATGRLEDRVLSIRPTVVEDSGFWSGLKSVLKDPDPSLSPHGGTRSRPPAGVQGFPLMSVWTIPDGTSCTGEVCRRSRTGALRSGSLTLGLVLVQVGSLTRTSLGRRDGVSDPRTEVGRRSRPVRRKDTGGEDRNHVDNKNYTPHSFSFPET